MLSQGYRLRQKRFSNTGNPAILLPALDGALAIISTVPEPPRGVQAC
jgi:hypothetical protein